MKKKAISRLAAVYLSSANRLHRRKRYRFPVGCDYQPFSGKESGFYL